VLVIAGNHYHAKFLFKAVSELMRQLLTPFTLSKNFEKTGVHSTICQQRGPCVCPKEKEGKCLRAGFLS
jgi:hypothetical protein